MDGWVPRANHALHGWLGTTRYTTRTLHGSEMSGSSQPYLSISRHRRPSRPTTSTSRSANPNPKP
eukprot:scaffold92539_cov51-Phaeocystis_antarctica.AAC.1